MCPNLGVFPLEQTRHVAVAKREHPRLTNDEIIFKESNLCNHNSPTLQTDRQTTCDRNTALCTKVHRAVKLLILPTPSLFEAPARGNPLEFLDEIYPTKTRRMGLLYGENFIILTSTVFL